MKYEFKNGKALINGEWVSIRNLLHEMDEKEFSVLAAGYEISHFEESHRHCGYCGAETVPAQDEISYARKCPNPDCKGNKNFLYPSYSIASITIVARNGGQEILLGHNTAWPANRVSLLAGFMQPGESLEECVKREVREESAIELGNIKYIKSQPWPFPSNIMAGFYAEATNPEQSKPDGKELDRLYWINKEQLKEVYAGTSHLGLVMPKKGSLARKLTDLWLAGKI